MNKVISFIIIYLLYVSAAGAQTTIGLPAIKNYNNTDYNASTQITDVKQDKNGILYFANDDGLLTFDGTYWKTYPMPNHTPIKAIAIDQSGRIYAGGQDEIGYFYPNTNGVLTFHSIKQLLPAKARQFADIWDIVIDSDQVFFRTIEAIFQYKNNYINEFDATGGWQSLAKVNHDVFACDKDAGLCVFRNNRWQPQLAKMPIANMHVTGITGFGNDTLLISTLKNGLYLLHGGAMAKMVTDCDPIFFNDLVNCVQKIGSNKFAIGTAANGVLIIDAKGRLVQKFSNLDGLQNSNVNHILLDNDGDLWLALENGAAFINYNTTIKHICPVKGNQSVATAIRIFGHKLYIGTTNGLYSTPLDMLKTDLSDGKDLFTQVANTNGRVWALNEIDHQLFLGSQDGAFVVNDDKIIPTTTRQGVWSLQLYPGTTDIIAGTYTGLELIKEATNSNFTDAGHLDGLYESLRNIAVDNNGNVWASHPYRGIFKMQLSADRKTIIHYEKYTGNNGLPSTQNNRVYFINNKVIVATEKGIYEYNAATDKFIASAFFAPIFKNTPIEFITKDGNGNLWFVNDGRVGVIDFSKRTSKNLYTVIYFPELTGQTVKGFEFIYPYNNSNIFIGANNGVYHLNYTQYTQAATKLKVLLSSVKSTADKDSLLFGGYFFNKDNTGTDQSLKQVISLPNRWNSFHFEYSSNLYAQKNNIDFSYKLKGFDNEWSAWSGKTEKDYTNLPYGIYTFSVKARNNLGNESAAVSYTFIITPAWYQTAWMYLFYIILTVLILRLIMLWQKKRFAMHQQKHEEEQARLSYLHSLELDRNEKEIIALKNQNLEAELEFKNKELATITMHLVERGGILSNFKASLLSIIKKTKLPDAEYEFRAVFRMLDELEKNAGDWSHFAIYFDQVHNNFLSTLKVKFPELSPTDLKLCAYLRLNLSSKEIAQLMNISLKGVEISRYRIRKKLNLTSEINLYDFLIGIVKSPL